MKRKDFKSSIRKKRYEMQHGDIVNFQKSRCSVIGMRNHGKSVVMKGREKNMDINTKKVKLVKHSKGMQFANQFSSTLTDEVSLRVIR
ncbi:MAG: hypothetical protein ACYDAO_07125 [Thermoplasmataceae archaeon]